MCLLRKTASLSPRRAMAAFEPVITVDHPLYAKMDGGDMQGVLPAPTVASSVPPELAMQQPTPVNLATIPNASTLPTAPSTQPEVTETLYIQNLNERIKLTGALISKNDSSVY